MVVIFRVPHGLETRISTSLAGRNDSRFIIRPRQRPQSRCCHRILRGYFIGPCAADCDCSGWRSDRRRGSGVAVSQGPQGADLLTAIVKGASSETKGLLAAVIAAVALIATASGVFGEMQAALNKIWSVESGTTTLSALMRARVVSLVLVAALGFLLLVSLAVSAAIASLSEFINTRLPFGAIMLSVLNTIVSLALLTALFAAIYKVLPDRPLAWRDVWFGAITTAILFTVGKSLIGWYLGTSAIASSYGAAGSLIVLLLWVFYSSCIFLFGAEVTRARFGLENGETRSA